MYNKRNDTLEIMPFSEWEYIMICEDREFIDAPYEVKRAKWFDYAEVVRTMNRERYKSKLSRHALSI